METSATARVESGAEPIESAEWLREFGEGYLAAWNSRDPEAVAARAASDVVWIDPALAEPARGRAAVAQFARDSFTSFPDLSFEEPGPPAISVDGLAAYVPWRMRGTNTGPIDPPGFAPTGRAIVVDGIDVWRFRDRLIWRYEAVYDFSALAAQLGLVPPRGGAAERAMARVQRLRAKLPL
jgi:predicted ester cyclase